MLTAKAKRARRDSLARDRRRRQRVRTLIEQVLRELTPQLAKHKIPVTRVNWGWCEDGARRLQEKLDTNGVPSLIVIDDDTLHDTDNEIFNMCGWTHAWVFAHGLHFDSECRMGTARWVDLPHFRRWVAPDTAKDRAGDCVVGEVVVKPRYSRDCETAHLSENAKARMLDLKDGLEVEAWLPKWLIEDEIDFDGDWWRGPI